MFKFIFVSLIMLSSTHAFAAKGGAGKGEADTTIACTVRTAPSAPAISRADRGYMQLTLNPHSKRQVVSIIRGAWEKMLATKTFRAACKTQTETSFPDKKPAAITTEISKQLNFTGKALLGQNLHATFDSEKSYSAALTRLMGCYNALEQLKKQREQKDRLAIRIGNKFEKLRTEFAMAKAGASFCKRLYKKMMTERCSLPKTLSFKRLRAKAIEEKEQLPPIFLMQLNAVYERYQEAKRKKMDLKKQIAGTAASCRKPDRFHVASKYYSAPSNQGELEKELTTCLQNDKLSDSLKTSLDSEYRIHSVKKCGQFIGLILRSNDRLDATELHISLMKMYSKIPSNSILSTPQQKTLLKFVKDEIKTRRNAKRLQPISFEKVMAQCPTPEGEYEMKELIVAGGTAVTSTVSSS